MRIDELVAVYVVTHHVDDHLAHIMPLFLVEVCEDVAAVLLQQFEGDGQMVVLQH